MGGAAFAEAFAQDEPTLNTPRMTPEQYERLKNVYLTKLQDYFPKGKIACLTEAPEKTDYGDMDVFVAIDQRVDFLHMAKFLGAAGVICHTSGNIQKCTLGVPLNGSAHGRSVVVYKHVDKGSGQKLVPSSTLTIDDYAQIDVEVISPDILAWHAFYSSYGDMAGVLGHIVHNLGFTVRHNGLWLRLPELDKSKDVSYVNIADRDGQIFLSSDPDVVMQFLGLSVQDYNDGFQTVDGLYEWLGKCRLISTYAIEWKRDNASERKKELTRTIFSRFFNEWLPAHPGIDREPEPSDNQEKLALIRRLRLKYLEEAVDSFGKRAEYEKMHADLTLVFENAIAAQLLRPIITEHSEKEGKSLNEIVRGFRRYVGFQPDRQPYVLEKPHSDAASQLHHFLAEDRESLRDPGGTRDWVRDNWEKVKGLERQRIGAIVGGAA